MDFDGRTLALGWLSVALAASEDDQRPQLYRTVLVEEHRRGVTLVATDSYWMATCFVPFHGHDFIDQPRLDEAPKTTWIVRDTDHRGRDLFRYIARITKPEASPPVELHMRPVKPAAAQLTLAPELELPMVRMEIPGRERVDLGVYDGTYPNWRTLDAAWVGSSASVFAMGPMVLPGLAKLSRLWPHAAAQFEFAGPMKPARFVFAGGEPEVSGLVMPVRTEATEAAA